MVAAFGGLIFFGFAYFINLLLLDYCQAFAVKTEHGWLSALAEVQSSLFGVISHFTGLDYFLNHEPSLTKTWLLISISDGFWFMFILLVFGFILHFASGVAGAIKPQNAK